MVTAILIFGAGLLGVIGHWLTRWSQNRTQSTFKEYLFIDKASTCNSIFANISSSGLIYANLPDDAAGKVLFMAVFAAYSAGYMLDSKVNKDPQDGPPAPLPAQAPVTAPEAPTPKKTLQEIKHENAEKPLQDLLDRDSAL